MTKRPRSSTTKRWRRRQPPTAPSSAALDEHEHRREPGWGGQLPGQSPHPDGSRGSQSWPLPTEQP